MRFVLAVDRLDFFLLFSFSLSLSPSLSLSLSLPQSSCNSTNSLPLLTLPIAESTITGRCSGNEQTMSATSRILVASATEEPPNL